MMNSQNYKRFKPRKVLFFIIMAVLFCAALGFVVMLLWNALLPDILGVKPISFAQAIGLFVLFRILFGGFKGGFGGKHRAEKRKQWKEKWMNMDETDRSQFKTRWKKHCDQKKEE